ncbi:hypothetical protein [Henriciella pelagia]|jgi:hypothetical protein|uniref:Uncharacterized protein n=1 Tax=Henriciella pelagia TaxID=1977912 RepID=A0ABQ1JIV3_9PROT|nr:hypothetical protein [Henriciella pelagia]GGB70092.1 hypothetical protein GCM10011503_18470 [Henriciella pelagia]
MKVKIDFISNSSSTSFVYIAESDLSEDAFFEAIGVDRESPVADIFFRMHSKLCSSIQRGRELQSQNQIDIVSDEYGFTPAIIDKMRTAVASGKRVVTGSLSSEEDLAEMVLCTSIFQIESDEFFINAYNSFW